jgi:hypothetical protein
VRAAFSPRTPGVCKSNAFDKSAKFESHRLCAVDTLLLPEFGADGDEGAAGAAALAARVGATAGLTKFSSDGPNEDGAIALGCWDGSAEDLEQLRGAGFGGLVLKNACNGDIAWGSRTKHPSLAANAVTGLIKASLSKGDKKVWGGAGGTGALASGKNEIASYYNRDDQPPRRRL